MSGEANARRGMVAGGGPEGSRRLPGRGIGRPVLALLLGACLGLVACQQDEAPDRPFVDGIGGAPPGGYEPNPGGGKNPGGDPGGEGGGEGGAGGGAGGSGGEPGAGGAGGEPGGGCGLGEMGLPGACSACVTSHPTCCEAIETCLGAMECAPFFLCASACEDTTCMLTCLAMHPLAAQRGGVILSCLGELCSEACTFQ